MATRYAARPPGLPGSAAGGCQIRPPPRAARRTAPRAALMAARIARAIAWAATMRSSASCLLGIVERSALLDRQPLHDVRPGHLEQQREVGERRPEAAVPRPAGSAAGSARLRAKMRSGSGGSSPRLRLARPPRRRSGRTRRTGAGWCRPPDRSRWPGWAGGGGTGSAAGSAAAASAISCAAAPAPRDVLILRPPMFRNSYGTLSGGSRSNTRRLMASARSREPPAVARSLPQPSIVAPVRPQRAAQSTFQTSLARPPKGEVRPWWPQPVAHSTRSALAVIGNCRRRPSRARRSCRSSRSSRR